MDALTKLQDHLRTLFQFDDADLDFGLYRLLGLKHDEIEAFLTEQLPRRVREAFADADSEGAHALEARLAELQERARREIAPDAILPDGSVKPEYRAMPVNAVRELVSDYDAARARRQAAEASEAQQAAIFNHLYTFFFRYYNDGDFIPHRRYGSGATYAVPYNGEEVFFHWANKDQHYVKTGENFRDYAFTVEALGGPFRVRFALTEATVTPNNGKGDVRHFFPRPDLAAWDADTSTFRLPFEYRHPTHEEAERYGKNSKGQEAVLVEVLPAILDMVPALALRAALSKEEERNGQTAPFLLRRLRHFTRRNTSDYFVHRHLERFLREELEFYLKDQVVHLADLEADLEPVRRTLRVVRRAATDIIAFLAQVEEVQKRLFEKPKFVLRTDYLAPIQNVPRDLWPELLANAAQVEEWRRLYALGSGGSLLNPPGPPDEAFLDEHPTLVVNTAHFDEGFKLRLLAGFEDLDEATDGLLVHSENYQALRFLLPRYAGEVKCIYIDPPYNTDSGPIDYKNGCRSSSWVSLMDGRLAVGRDLLADDGIICVTIDDYQIHELANLLNVTFGRDSQLGTIVIRNNPSGRSTVKGLSVCHEYAFFYRRTQSGSLAKLPRSQQQWERFTQEEGIHVDWRNFRKDGGAITHRNMRPKQFYPIYVNVADNTLRIPQLSWRSELRKWDVLEPAGEHEIEVWPIDENGKDRVWSLNHISARDNLVDLQVRLSRDGSVQVFRRHTPDPGVLPRTWWDKNTYAAREHGSAALTSLFGVSSAFSFAKSPFAVQDSLWIAGLDHESERDVLDFFAGSGTTGHAVINLNREDGGQRKFLLVEMADYFDTVLLPRLQKVILTPEWQEGKPKRLPTAEEAERTPRLVKVLRLEGYEDALCNLHTEETPGRGEPRAGAFREALKDDDAFRLRYLLRLPLEESATMLHLEGLDHPFAYTLETLTDDGPKVSPVDLVETFNYLYGLRAQRIETWENPADARRYRAVKATAGKGQRVLVLWRDVADLDPDVERRFLEERISREGPFEEVLVNGDCALPDARSLDPIFKQRMEEGER